MAKDLMRHFPREDIQKSYRLGGRYLVLLIIKEMKIKMIMRCHFISVKICYQKEKNMEGIAKMME